MSKWPRKLFAQPIWELTFNAAFADRQHHSVTWLLAYRDVEQDMPIKRQRFIIQFHWQADICTQVRNMGYGARFRV